MATLVVLGVIFLITKGAALERSALVDPTGYAIMISILAWPRPPRWRMQANAKSGYAELQFEDAPPPAIQSLGLSQ